MEPTSSASASPPPDHSLPIPQNKFPQVDLRKGTVKFVDRPPNSSSLEKVESFLRLHGSLLTPAQRNLIDNYLQNYTVKPLKKLPFGLHRVVQSIKNLVVKRSQSEEKLRETSKTLLAELDKVSDLQKEIAKAAAFLDKSSLDKTKQHIDVVEDQLKTFLQEHPEPTPALSSVIKKIEENIQLLTEEISSRRSSLNTNAELRSDEILVLQFTSPSGKDRMNPDSLINAAGIFASSIPSEIFPIKIAEQKGEEIVFKDDDKTLKENQDQDQIHHYGDSQNSFSCISGYPLDTKAKHLTRLGDPVADDMRFKRFTTKDSGEVIIFSGADGSGWGKESAKAAQNANLGFLKHCETKLARGINSVNDLVEVSVKGVKEAEDRVSNTEGGGSTTHLGMIIKKNPDGSAKGVLTSVGDMKVFIRRKNGEIEEVTKGNRANIKNVNDPGGQLRPDSLYASNLRVYVFDLEEGDSVLPMSDGVYDNLNPQVMGIKTPQEAFDKMKGSSFLSKNTRENLSKLELKGKTWEEIGPQELNTLTESYMAFQIGSINAEKQKGQSLDQALVSKAYDLTEQDRKYMEKNPTARLPNKSSTEQKGKLTYQTNPGKMDHISCGMITL